jgi:hypothetical protein
MGVWKNSPPATESLLDVEEIQDLECVGGGDRLQPTLKR